MSSPFPYGPDPATGPSVRAPASGEPRPDGREAVNEAARGGPSRRTKVITGLSIAVAIVLVAAVIALVHPGAGKDAPRAGTPVAAGGSPSAEPAPTPVLAVALGAGKPADPAAVQRALDPLVAATALGGSVGATVLDPTTGQVVYARNADIMTLPASTTKILTATTVLAARGPAYRLTTRAVAGAVPGEVVLIGGGDPTLAVGPTGEFPGAARLDQLAEQVRKALGGTKPTKLTIDTTLFAGPETGLGWDADNVSPGGQVAPVQALMTNGGRVTPVHNEGGGDPRFPDPALAAGKSFARLLGIPEAAVKRGKAPAGGAGLGSVQSPPLVEIVDWMLQQSDNTIAETMARQVALAAGKPATFDAAAEAMVAKLQELGLPSDEADLYDGSGLSRHDGVSPHLLTATLSLAASGKQPAITSIFAGLPVAGWSGTLTNRFATPATNKAAQGNVRAKTGTLSGVNTMAGQLVTKDGRLLVFAVMASGTPSAAKAKSALDAVVARLARCGC
jgi:D-alanyl-D-alanine carboxypeptidase/D-alanyl-D-alanine-endopeptidase (penicillin-binding protein 4)